jgi:hypothetical protein
MTAEALKAQEAMSRAMANIETCTIFFTVESPCADVHIEMFENFRPQKPNLGVNFQKRNKTYVHISC